MRWKFSHLKKSRAPVSSSAVREVSDRRAVRGAGDPVGGGGDVGEAGKVRHGVLQSESTARGLPKR